MRQKKQLFEITKIIQTCAYPNSRPTLRIYYGMKKIITVLILALITLIPLGGCKKKINYADYISEKRTNIYVYEDDTRSVKIHCSQREQPYAADGIKGAMNGICEIFVTLDKNPQELYAEINGHRGDMGYKAVDGCYYLSFTAEDFKSDNVQITLSADGKAETFTALSVLYDGVLTCDEALDCVIEHDKTLFDGLTQNNGFSGEIYVRLLSDDGCYYYVGVCGRDGAISAFLVDGEHGKVIATKKLNSPA